MFRFKRRSEVVTVASDDHAPWSVPPSEVMPKARLFSPYSSIVVSANFAYVLLRPLCTFTVRRVLTERTDPRVTMSKTDKHDPKRALENREKAEPRRCQLLNDSELARIAKSQT